MKFIKDSKIGIIELLFWTIMATVIPFVYHTINFLQFIQINIFFCSSFFVGELFFCPSVIFKKIPFLVRAGINILIGGIIISTLAYLIDTTYLIYALFITFIFTSVYFKRITIYVDYRDFLSLIPLMFLYINPVEFFVATKQGTNIIPGDYFYYTAITESLSRNFNFSSAFYHIKLPINYSVLPFQTPALISKFASTRSWLALFGIYSRLLPMISFATISYFIVSYAYKIAEYTPTDRNKVHYHKFFANFSLLFLGPINIMALIKLDFKNVLFLGMGYALPLGSLGFALAMFFTGLILIYLFLPDKEPLKFVYPIVFLFAIIFSKIALFIPLLVLIGIYSLYKRKDKDYKLFLYLLFGMPFLYWGYRFIAGNDPITKIELIPNGYFYHLFFETAEKYHLGKLNTIVKIFCMLVFSMINWLSIKAIIGYFAFKKSPSEHRLEVKRVIYCCFAALIVTLSLGFFLEIYGVDASKKVIYDVTEDSRQFLRAGIFLVSIFCFSFLLYFVFFYAKGKYKKMLLTLTAIIAILNSYSFFSSTYPKATTSDNSWYMDVSKDYEIAKPKLMVVRGEEFFSGTYLSSLGIGPWYCTGTRNSKEGYTMNLSSHNRNIYFQKLLDTLTKNDEKVEIINHLKSEKVDCIVATPKDTATYSKLVMQNLLIKKDGTKWMYNFK